MVSKEDLAWRGVHTSQAELDPRFTLHRVTNCIFIVCHFAAMICHIICFGVLLSKHSEIKDKIPLSPNTDVCILYMDSTRVGDSSKVEFKGGHSCDFVIIGSIILSVLAVISQIVLLIRTILVKKMNFLGLYDFAEIVVAVLLAFSVSVVLSIGRSVTCDKLTHAEDDKCSGIYIFHKKDDDSRVKIYSALKSAETSSWVAFLFLLMIAVLATVRTIRWCRKLHHSKSVPISVGLIDSEVKQPVDEEVEVNKTPAVI